MAVCVSVMRSSPRSRPFSLPGEGSPPCPSPRLPAEGEELMFVLQRGAELIGGLLAAAAVGMNAIGEVGAFEPAGCVHELDVLVARSRNRVHLCFDVVAMRAVE